MAGGETPTPEARTPELLKLEGTEAEGADYGRVLLKLFTADMDMADVMGREARAAREAVEGFKKRLEAFTARGAGAADAAKDWGRLLLAGENPANRLNAEETEAALRIAQQKLDELSRDLVAALKAEETKYKLRDPEQLAQVDPARAEVIHRIFVLPLQAYLSNVLQTVDSADADEARALAALEEASAKMLRELLAEEAEQRLQQARAPEEEEAEVEPKKEKEDRAAPELSKALQADLEELEKLLSERDVSILKRQFAYQTDELQRVVDYLLYAPGGNARSRFDEFFGGYGGTFSNNTVGAVMAALQDSVWDQIQARKRAVKGDS